MIVRNLALTALVLASLAPAAARADDTATAAPAWKLDLHGVVRAGFEQVAEDDRYDFIGRNDGFVLHNARLSLDASHADGLLARVSLEGATDLGSNSTTPSGTLDVRLRDAWVGYQPLDLLRVRVGQYKPGFLGESQREPSDYRFVTPSLLASGVTVGAGFETPGLALDRGLGAELSTGDGLKLSSLTVKVSAGAWNGNGSNQRLNDNPSLAVGGRLELGWDDLVTLGVAGYQNARTTGALPDRFEETDTGLAADLRLEVAGAWLLAQAAQVTTAYGTVEVDDRTQAGWSAEGGYDVALSAARVGLAYRYATLDPWSEGSAERAHEELTAHTVGLRIRHPGEQVDFGLSINHTVTIEHESRELNNDRTEIGAEVVF